MSTVEPIAYAQKMVLITANQQSGWWPVTGDEKNSVREVVLNIEVQFDSSGYLLCYSSVDGLLYGDTWHVSEDEAKQVAFEDFGIQSNEWRHA